MRDPLRGACDGTAGTEAQRKPAVTAAELGAAMYRYGFIPTGDEILACSELRLTGFGRLI